jgi:hypothetical protein
MLESLLVAVLTLVVGYFVGLRQAEQQRIIEERARVISALFERYADVHERVASLVQVYDYGGEPDKKEKFRLAAESFNELLRYHRRTSIWLSRPTARYVDRFIERYRQTFTDFSGERGYPDDARKWLAVWQRFKKESPELREALEEEFRASLGDTRAKLWRLRRGSELVRPQSPALEPPQSREDGSQAGG